FLSEGRAQRRVVAAGTDRRGRLQRRPHGGRSAERGSRLQAFVDRSRGQRARDCLAFESARTGDDFGLCHAVASRRKPAAEEVGRAAGTGGRPPAIETGERDRGPIRAPPCARMRVVMTAVSNKPRSFGPFKTVVFGLILVLGFFGVAELALRA